MATVYTTRIIPGPASGPNGARRHYVDTNNNRVADTADPVLVKFGDDGWKPVEQIEGSVDRFTLEQDYGYWKDREVSHREGWPWNRRTVVDRPLDGKIDGDELGFPQFQRFGDSGTFELGAELIKDDQGRLSLEEHYQTYPALRIIGQGDIQTMQNYRADDSNWRIATK